MGAFVKILWPLVINKIIIIIIIIIIITIILWIDVHKSCTVRNPIVMLCPKTKPCTTDLCFSKSSG